MVTLEAANVLAGVLTAVGALCAGIAAIIGLSTWQDQHKLRVNYELARRLLVATLKVRDEFKNVRMPYVSAGEMEAAASEANIEASEAKRKHLEVQGAVYSRRIRRLQAALTVLNAETIEAEALWGDYVNTIFDPLDKRASKLIVGIQMYFMYLRDDERSGRTRQVSTSEAEHREKSERMLYSYSTRDEPDEFDRELVTEITAVKSYLRPKLLPL